MNHSTAQAGNEPKRPASIAELAEMAQMAMLDLWDDTKDFKHYLRKAEKYRKEGREYARKGDIEGAFVELAQAATLVLEKLPMHREYNFILNATQRQNLYLNGQDILENLSALKLALFDRYEKWLQKHPDGVEHEQTPNARTQKITPEDTAARAQVQREQFQAEERARYQAREQQRIAAEELAKWRRQQRIVAKEAAKWRRQREQLQAQEEVERTRRENAAADAARQAAATHAPDYRGKQTKWKLEQLQAQDDVERTARTTAVPLAAALETQDAATTSSPDYMFSAAEAVKRGWQRQQLQAQDDVEGTQTEIAAANPPDYTFSRKGTIVASDAFPPEEANRHHKSSSGTTSHRSQPVDLSSTFYRIDHEDGPESLTPNANQTVHLPPENSQLDTAPWILASRKLHAPKRPTDLQFMTRMAKLRQQTDGSSITSSTSQVEQMYLLGSPASFVSSFSQSFSIASTPPAVEFPPTPVFTDERIFQTTGT